eukprot:g1251.t1
MRGLRNADWMGKSDPYYKVGMPACFPEEYVSKHVDNTLEPTFSERAVFLVPEGVDNVTIYAYDHDDHGSDDEIGHVRLQFPVGAIGAKIPPKWFALEPQGEVQFGVSIVSVTDAIDCISAIRADDQAQQATIFAMQQSAHDNAGAIAALQAAAAEAQGAAAAAQADDVQDAATIAELRAQVSALVPFMGPEPLAAMAGKQWILRCVGSGDFTGQVVHLDGDGDKLLSARHCQSEGDQSDFCKFTFEGSNAGGFFIRCAANGEIVHVDGLGDKLVSSRHCQGEGEQDDFCKFRLEGTNAEGFIIRCVATGENLHLDASWEGADKLLSTRFCQGAEINEYCRFTLAG